MSTGTRPRASLQTCRAPLQRRYCALLGLCATLCHVLVCGASARAQEDPQPEQMQPMEPLRFEPPPPGPAANVRERQAYWTGIPLPEPVPPPGFSRKRPLSEAQRRQKRAQRPVSVIGVPQFGGNPDYGIIVGAVAVATWMGEESDALYDYSPFKRQLLVQAQVGLKKRPNILSRQAYTLRYVRPYVADSIVSVTAEADFLMNGAMPFYGATAESMGALNEVGPAAVRDKSFATYRDYERALRGVRPDGTTYSAYNDYVYTEPRAMATAKVDLLGGILIPAVSVKLGKVFVERYGGQTVRASGGKARSLPTKLDEECDTGRATHCNGTWDNTLKAALTLDVRDFPIDPDNGALVDVSFEGAPKAFGSPGYWRATTSASVYVSPLEQLFGLDDRWSQLVFAARLLYSVTGGDMPFYAKNRLSFSTHSSQGLGGIYTLRGYRLDRFVGGVAALANLELRYDLYVGETNRSTFNFKFIPFFDAGRVWDDVSQTNLRGYRIDAGGGLCLQWNHVNILRGDVGVGDEGVSGGISYGLMF